VQDWQHNASVVAFAGLQSEGLSSDGDDWEAIAQPPPFPFPQENVELTIDDLRGGMLIVGITIVVAPFMSSCLCIDETLYFIIYIPMVYCS